MDQCDSKVSDAGKTSSRNSTRIRLIVLHDEEFPEGPNSAEQTVSYLSSSSVRASINAAVDEDTVAGMVDWSLAAWHAAHGATNGCSVGWEHDGYAKQSREEWLDTDHGVKTLDRSARLGAWACQTFGIEPVHLTGQALRDCVLNNVGSGYCGHGDVTDAFSITGGHTDPGPQFPYDWWEARVRSYISPGTNTTPALEDDVQITYETAQVRGGLFLLRYVDGKIDSKQWIANDYNWYVQQYGVTHHRKNDGTDGVPAGDFDATFDKLSWYYGNVPSWADAPEQVDAAAIAAAVVNAIPPAQLPTVDVAAIAKAVNDEFARRQAS